MTKDGGAGDDGASPAPPPFRHSVIPSFRHFPRPLAPPPRYTQATSPRLAWSPAMGADRPTILCVASFFKGERFLSRCKQEGCRVLLLTSERFLREPWPRGDIDEVFALP